MSLRAFHILFIILSTLLSFGFAVWAYGNYKISQSTTDLVLTVGGAVLGVALVIYGIWFIRKSRKLIL